MHGCHRGGLILKTLPTHKVHASGATLVIGAPKHKGGSGDPARIFAMI